MEKIWTDIIDKHLKHSLRGYAHFFKKAGFDVEFEGFPRIKESPEKGYSARTDVPLIHKGYRSNLVVIAFRPGDGTGNGSSYSLNDLVVPDNYNLDCGVGRILPRKKGGVLIEAFLPLFSVYNENVLRGVVSLEELTVVDEYGDLKLDKAWDLGCEQQRFRSHISLSYSGECCVYLTTGYRANGKRFGDPHSVFYGIDHKALQVAGFIGVKDENDPMGDVLAEIGIIPDNNRKC